MKRSQILPITFQSASKLLAAAARRCALSLAKAISIDGVDGSCSRRREFWAGSQSCCSLTGTVLAWTR